MRLFNFDIKSGTVSIKGKQYQITVDDLTVLNGQFTFKSPLDEDIIEYLYAQFNKAVENNNKKDCVLDDVISFEFVSVHGLVFKGLLLSVIVLEVSNYFSEDNINFILRYDYASVLN